MKNRTPDIQYRQLLRHILYNGRTVKPIQGGEAKMVVGAQFHFDMRNGFPLITERDLSKGFKGALGEHIAFLNGARTIDELQKFGCPRVFWERWVSDPKKSAEMGLALGDLGRASYGPAWTSFPTENGVPFNQIKNLVEMIKQRPHLRTFFVSPWIPDRIHNVDGRRREVMVAPCHGWIHILVFPDDAELSIHHFQRSCDLPVGVAFNLVQYAAFGMMLGKLTGYTMRELVYTFSDVHIYESQYPYVEKLMDTQPRAFPTMEINLRPEVSTLADFRREDFVLRDYDPNPAMQIPTPV